MTLTPTFNLTPRESRYHVTLQNRAHLKVYGATFLPNWYVDYAYNFDNQYAMDRIYYGMNAADPALDYTIWENWRLAPHIELAYDLRDMGANKELALVFGFETESDFRLLIYNNDGLVSDETIAEGDSQLLIVVETLAYFSLRFIHARMPGSNSGGDWFFKGIVGYVV